MKCACCGEHRARKRIRAVIVTDKGPPRMGLVCQLCARCGVLVVPGALRMLRTAKRRVSRSVFARKVVAETVVVEPDPRQLPMPFTEDKSERATAPEDEG